MPREKPIRWHDETLSLAGWARRYGVAHSTLTGRMARGVAFEVALQQAPATRVARARLGRRASTWR